MLFGAPALPQQALLGAAAAAPAYGGAEQPGAWPSSGHSTPPLDMVRVTLFVWRSEMPTMLPSGDVRGTA